MAVIRAGGGDPPSGNSFAKRGIVAFGLVGVGAGEFADCLIECGRVAQVGGDRDPVAGAGVPAGQRPRANLAVIRQAI